MCPNINSRQIRDEFNEIVTALGGNPLTVEEFKNKELRLQRTGTDAAAMDAAYDIWDQNQGNPIDKAPNGSESILFKSLMNHYGDRQKAIRAKANTYSEAFKNWFGDWTSEDTTNVSKVVDENGEPLIVWHHTDDPNLVEFSIEFDNYFAKDGGTKKAIFFDENTTGTLNRKYDLPGFLNIRQLTTYKGTKEDLHKKGTTYRQVVNESAEANPVDGGLHMAEFDDNRMENQSIWIIHNPNQSKSIDNDGNFSTTDNNRHHQKKTGINNRRKHFTTEEWALSQRLSTVLRQLFPEISVEFVDSIEGGYVGEIDLSALKVLIDKLESGLDTIPHEYAHYYIAMFKDTPLVQKGIEMFGSEETLVQAVGVRTVEMEGKTRNWWQKFIDFIKKMLNKNKLAKQMLLAEITDAFLERKQLTRQEAAELSGVRYQEDKQPTIEEVRNLILSNQAQIDYDGPSHSYTERATGKKLTPVTDLKKEHGYDTYDKSAEDELQQQISSEASDNGKLIHAVFEDLINGTFKRSNYKEKFTDNALDKIKEVFDDLRSTYDFVMSEAMLCDTEHGIAGTADLIVRNKKTGEYELLDFKTKMVTYNKTKKNKKGKNLYGFFYVDSTKHGLNTTRLGYDFQLTAYQHMLEKLGIKISRRAIVPLAVDVNNDKISNVYVSKMFGKQAEEDAKHGTYEIKQNKQVLYDVKHKVFGQTEGFGIDVTQMGEALDSIRSAVEKITKKLRVQQQIFKLRGQRAKTQEYEARKALEKIEGLDQLDCLYQYVDYAAKQLERLAKQIEKRYKQGADAQWDLEVLVLYRSVANSYSDIEDLIGIAERYQSLFGESMVTDIRKKCMELQKYQTTILGACKNIGTELHLKAIQPHIGNVRYQFEQEERKKYIEENPKKAGESKKQFETRVREHLEKYMEDHAAEIEYKTKKWLIEQTKTANSSFECNMAQAQFYSVYESKDPLVQGTVILFDKMLNEQERTMYRFKTSLEKAVKAFRAKYGVGNFSNLKEIFDDFVEIVETGDDETPYVAYLVNEKSGKYMQAELKAKKEIFKDESLTHRQRSEKFQEWLNVHCPIIDQEAFDNEVKELLEAVYNQEEEKVTKAIKENLALPAEKRKSWYKMLKEGTITEATKDMLDEIEYNIESKYRRPNPEIYKNEKYAKMMQYKASNDPAYQLYKVLADAVNSVDHQLPGNLRLKYRLPGVVKRGAERVGADGLMSAISNKFQQNIVSMADDDIRGTFVNEEGKKLNQVPLFFNYSKKITLEEQSFDLPTVFYKWYDSATMYVAKKQIEGNILQTSAILHSRDTYDNTFSLLGKNGQKERTASHKTNTQNQYDAWVDQVFYGNRVEDMGSFKLPFSDKRLDLAKTIRSIIKYGSKRTMLGNAVSAVNNFLVAQANQLEEVFAGEFTTKEAYLKAAGIYTANIPGMLNDVNRVVPRNKINQLAELFGIFDSGQNMMLTGLMRHSLNDYGYALTKVGDRACQGTFMVSMLLSMDAVDENGNVIGNMWDMISVNEDGELIVDERVTNFGIKEQDDFQLKLRRVMMGLHGNYNTKRAAVAAETKWYGYAGLALRRWIAPSIERRFASPEYNNMTKSERGGFLGTGFSYMFYKNPAAAATINFFLRFKKDGEKYKVQALRLDQMDDYTKRNFIRWVVEYATAGIAIIMFSLLGGSDGDDDDAATSFLRYQMYRLWTDMTFFVLPTSFSKILNDPFPVMSVLTDITMFIQQMFSPFEEYATGNHMFDNKLIDKGYKLIPGVKQIGRIQNIASEMEVFMRQR